MEKLKLIYCVFCLLIVSPILSQEIKQTEIEINISPFIVGTLLNPNTSDSKSLAIIIGDYGPTDRNGNQNFQKSNTLKKLAYGLAEYNIASFRYDKRIVKQIKKGRVNAKMTFNDF